MKLSLALSILLLFAGGVWALEQEDAIELTCRLNDVVVQFHIGENTNKSWYKLTRESNQIALDYFKTGKSWNRLSRSLNIFFKKFKYKHLNRYFDVSHFRFKGYMRLTDVTIEFGIEPLTGTRSGDRKNRVFIDRVSGEAHAEGGGGFTSNKRITLGKCLPGLIEWERKDTLEQERKF